MPVLGYISMEFKQKRNMDIPYHAAVKYVVYGVYGVYVVYGVYGVYVVYGVYGVYGVPAKSSTQYQPVQFQPPKKPSQRIC